jgi:hypothetical protein
VSFGGQTVTLRSVVLGSAGRMGIKAKTSASTTWAGVLFRPVQSTEPTGGNTDVITQMFKATGPATTASLAADETYEMDYGGDTFVITEVRKHPDFSGQIHHVSMLCRKWRA